MAPPFKAVKVTGALFHTQGGLAVDRAARVLDTNGKPLPNIFAAGGAAAGVSGPRASGYLSGNGLLTATVLGRVAGQAAAALVKQRTPASALDEAHRRKKPNSNKSGQSSLPRRLLNRALPSPVPIVSTPQCSTSSMNGRSLKPCTTASLCMMMTVS